MATACGFWRTGTLPGREAVLYMGAQIAGAIAGVVLANLTFGLSAASIATTDRSTVGMVVAEAVVTFVLVLLILGLVRSGNGAAVAPAVGAWVAAIIIATVSTGFANPAVTIARALTDTFAGIAPSGVPAFLAAQFLAGLAATFVAVAFYPGPARGTQSSSGAASTPRGITSRPGNALPYGPRCARTPRPGSSRHRSPRRR